MSSSSRQLSSISPEATASREDLELFQRLLRVARLLNNHDLGDLCTYSITPRPCAPVESTPGNQTPSLNHAGHIGASDGRQGSSDNGNTSSRVEQDAGTDMTYDDYDDDEYDDDDEEGEESREGSTNAVGRSDQLVIPNNINSSQPSRRKASSKRQNSPDPALTRRRRRQRPDQQQQQQQYERPHAAVEKRYRSVVNSKIQQLRASIPPSNTFSPTDANTPPESRAAEAAQEMPTKSIVLDSATQYINHLVATYQQYETERTELRRKLQLWLDNISATETTARSATPN